MRPSPVIIARRRLGTVSYVGTGAVSSTAAVGDDTTPGYPSGLQAGDILIIDACNSGSQLFATNAVSGFTRRNAQATTGSVSPTLAIFYKISDGTESGTITVTNPSGATTNVSKMYAYRGVDQTNPFDVADAVFASSTAVTAYVIPTQTPTLVGAAAHTLAVGNVNTGTWTPPSTYTELYDGGNSQSVVMEGAHKLALPASATGTRTATKSSSVRGVAIGLILRPGNF